jgi:phosphoribosylanthranilate isomerase
MHPRPRLKVCCIQSPAEAELALAAGADAVGLVAAMPSGPGVITEAAIAEIVARVPPPVATFLLTSEVNAAAIIAQQRRTRANTLQLCDAVGADVLRELRRELPTVKRVQVIHVSGPAALDEAREVAPWADALLLDSGNPALAVKELGGTGRVHDWSVSRRIREAVRIPVFLAGGLHAGNVAAAIAAVEPFGIDVCTGVRVGGRLDADRLAAFVTALSGDRA